MVKFECKNCKKIFNKKSTYINHTEYKKYPCVSNIKNKYCLEIKDNGAKEVNNDKSNDINNKIFGANDYIGANKNKNIDNIELKKEKIMCKFCCKIFLYNKNLNKHIREERCEVLKLQNQQKENIFINLVKEDEINNQTNNKLNKISESDDKNQILLLFNELKEMKNIFETKLTEQKILLEKESYEKKIINEKILELEKNNLELQKLNYKLQNKMDKIVLKNKVKINKNSNINITNTKNSNNTQNITNNLIVNNHPIKLVDFGKEDLNKISHNIFIDTIKSQGTGLYNKALEGIHFNKDYPENQNIYISDFNRDKVMIYKNEKWIIDNWDTIFPVLLEKVVQFGYDKNEFLKDCDYKLDGKKFNKQMIKNGMRWYKLLYGEEPDVEYFELDENDRPEIDEETYNDYLEMQEFRKKHPKKETELNLKNKMKMNIYNKRELPIENYKKIANINLEKFKKIE